MFTQNLDYSEHKCAIFNKFADLGNVHPQFRPF